MALEEVINPGDVGEKDLAVVRREFLLDGKPFSGVKVMDEEELFQLLTKHLEFKERTQVLEQDPTFKQIIPYFVVRRGEEYLTARRRNTGGEKRLYGGRLIGFGGHLRAGDIKGKMSEWLQREFNEEIEAKNVLGISFLGIVNHDGDEDKGVHKVHFGLVFEMKVEGEANVKEGDDLEDGEFLSVKELLEKRDEMELWSRLVTEFLAATKLEKQV